MEYPATSKTLAYLACVAGSSLAVAYPMIRNEVEIVEGGAGTNESLVFFILVVVAAAFMVMAIRRGLSHYLYVMTEYMSILVLPFFVVTLVTSSLLLGAGASIALLAAKLSERWNMFPLFESYVISVCIASIMGITFAPVPLIVLLMLLSVYDIIAVKKTGYMKRLAEDVIENRGPQMVTFSSRADEVSIGLADIIFPCAFAVSAAISASIYVGIAAILLSMAGLWIMFSRPSKEGMPALPYGSLGVAAYLLSLLA